MKFVYEYRTHDNILHSDTISASSREAAYSILKGSGIKPSRVNLAPGTINKLCGVLHTWWFALLLIPATVLIGGIFYRLLSGHTKAWDTVTQQSKDNSNPFDAPNRRQIIGDTAAIDLGIRNGWMDVFPQEGEQFLASFAIPGAVAAKRNTNEAELSAALERDIAPVDEDSIEVRQIKAMVRGMKEELRGYIAAGGSYTSYGNRLVERQTAEQRYYTRIKAELENEYKENGITGPFFERWEQRNAALRRLGLPTLSIPEEETEP